MQTLKILLGVLALVLAWAYLFRTRLIYSINAWMRHTVFSDRLVLFSGRRVAALLLVLGSVSLFSGLDRDIFNQPLKPKITAEMMSRTEEEFARGQYHHAVSRSRELVKANPKNERAWEIMALSWWALGKKDAAIKAVEALMHANPFYPIQKSPLLNINSERSKKMEDEKPSQKAPK